MNGDIYEGNFKGGNFNGTGTYTFKEGTIIQGFWKDNILEGNALYDDMKDLKIEGEFENSEYDDSKQLEIRLKKIKE